jgi:hypothetical protein
MLSFAMPLSPSPNSESILKSTQEDNENDLSLQSETDAASDVPQQHSSIPSASLEVMNEPMPITEPPVNQTEEDASASPPAKRLKYVQYNFVAQGELSRRC